MPFDAQQFIKDLIKTKDKDELTPEVLKEWQKNEIWEDMVQFLKQEQTKLGHTPIWESDFPGQKTSLFEYLNNYIDLDKSPTDYNFNTILNNLSTITQENGTIDTTNKNYPWNESLANAIAHYLRYFQMTDNFEGKEFGENAGIRYNSSGTKVTETNGSISVEGTLLDDVGGFRIASIKNGDAGHSFEESPWVIPNYNVDKETYDAVRGIDEILEALTNDKEMQYTHTQNQAAARLNKYIRLLMPKYLRRVEVEDLDRNFWVIGNIIAAISAYLFDPNSPITNEFKKILNELIQLWENVLYLWVLFMLLSQKPYYTDVHTEVVYMPNEDFSTTLKYDNFDIASPLNMGVNDIKARLRSFQKAYSESNLCIIPVLRGNNYYRNRYKIEKYPGVYFYNRNTDTESFVPFINLTIDATDEFWTKRCGAIREENEMYYYAQPMYKIGEIKDIDDVNTYYNALRSIPVNVVGALNDSGKLYLNGNFEIDVMDAARKAYYNTTVDVATITLSDPVYEDDSSATVNISGNAVLNKDDMVQPGIQVTRGFYFGELASNAGQSSGLTYNVTSNFLTLYPIIEANPQIDQQMKDADYLALTDYVSNLSPSSSFDSIFNLYIGEHKTGFIDNGQKDYTERYYGLTQNNTYDFINKKMYKPSAPTNRYSSSSTYAAGDKVINTKTIIIDGVQTAVDEMYECNVTITTPEEFNPNKWTDLGRAVFTAFGGKLYPIAALFDLKNPSEVHVYKDYEYAQIHGWGLSYGLVGSGAKGWEDTQFYVYTPNGEPIGKDNWCIRCVQASGVCTFDDDYLNNLSPQPNPLANKNIDASDLTNSNGPTGTYTINGTEYPSLTSKGICVAVKISLFYGRSTDNFSTITYYRAVDGEQSTQQLIQKSSNIRDWQTKDEVNNYLSHRQALSSGWRKKTGPDHTDFEINPINGNV